MGCFVFTSDDIAWSRFNNVSTYYLVILSYNKYNHFTYMCVQYCMLLSNDKVQVQSYIGTAERYMRLINIIIFNVFKCN